MSKPRKRVLIGLIGAPIKHSASPAMHEAAADALGLKGFFQLIEVVGADTSTLKSLLENIRLIGFSGVSVTYPYKEAVVPLLDELSPTAKLIGAVNAIAVKDGRLCGFNTDASGFGRAVAPLLKAMPGPVAVIGAGGVGKAAAVAMADAGTKEIRIFDSDPNRSDALSKILGKLTCAISVRTIEAALDGAVGLVNGTPVGMWPNQESPVPASSLRKAMWVADAVYSPLWTPLLLDAQRIGAIAMTGRDLLINQAVDAFELFTGVKPDAAVMAKAFEAK